MTTTNKQIRSFYINAEQLKKLECEGTSINKQLQEILNAYFDKEFYTPREKIIRQTKKILAIAKHMQENEKIEKTDIDNLTIQIEEAVIEIQKNLNKI
ncbi:MAG: hypothetical protein COX07_03950 [Bacteroidetes bacterium CG23_combo_of_CG06-09_8_20_14_all_32_9]|nr:MAG: hypothetical protein COX07_03950 [Bacteroidetes bacterium CG23_combo_of_CG06-09_8_20_14_all_32_9]